MRLTVVPPDENREAHTPICSHCGQPWPCQTAKRVRAERYVREQREMDCAACGKQAKSARSWLALSPHGGLRLVTFCGPAKRRSCSEVGDLFYVADKTYRASLDVAP